MPEIETRMGGAEGAFPETVWSAILASSDEQSQIRRAALDRFVALYWRPVYRFARCWGKPVEDAKDVAQSFFCHVLERGTIGRYEREKGRFRHFLKGALRKFLLETDRGERALKRGGDRKLVPLDVADLESGPAGAQARGQSPEAAFDQQWVAEVLARGLARLRDDLTREGRAAWLRVYELYELAPEGPEAPTYESVARVLGLAPHDVKNHLTHVRARLRSLIVDQLAQTANSREEVLAELEEVLAG